MPKPSELNFSPVKQIQHRNYFNNKEQAFILNNQKNNLTTHKNAKDKYPKPSISQPKFKHQINCL